MSEYVVDCVGDECGCTRHEERMYAARAAHTQFLTLWCLSPWIGVGLWVPLYLLIGPALHPLRGELSPEAIQTASKICGGVFIYWSLALFGTILLTASVLKRARPNQRRLLAASCFGLGWAFYACLLVLDVGHVSSELGWFGL